MNFIEQLLRSLLHETIILWRDRKSTQREAPWSTGKSSSATVQNVAVSREFEARLRHAATGKLSLSTQQKMGTFFELGKDKTAKGEGWAPPFISCAQDTVGL